MRTLWMVLAWISAACGLAAYLTGWAALLMGKVFWNIPTEFWFYDAVAAGVFGMFFLIFGAHAVKDKK